DTAGANTPIANANTNDLSGLMVRFLAVGTGAVCRMIIIQGVSWWRLARARARHFRIGVNPVPVFSWSKSFRSSFGRAGNFFLCLCKERSHQERKHTPRARSTGILPSDSASPLRGLLTAHPCAGSKLARVLRAIAARRFLRGLAAPEGPQRAAHIPCAQKQTNSRRASLLLLR